MKKGGPLVERIFNEVIFLFLKELLFIAHFISHEFDIIKQLFCIKYHAVYPTAGGLNLRTCPLFHLPGRLRNGPGTVPSASPPIGLKTPSGEQKTENFFVPYRVVLKRDRTTDVAEP